MRSKRSPPAAEQDSSIDEHHDMTSYERLTALDRFFVDIESYNTHMHVAAVMLFESAPLANADGGIDVERIRSYIASRLHLIPRYRQKLAHVPLTGQPVWIDDERLNLHYHVRHTALPKPGDLRQLKRLAARIMSQKLDRGKPLWEVWFVEGLEDGSCAMISKTHHSMIDGVSGVDLMTVLLSIEADSSVHDVPAWSPRPAPGAARLIGDELLRRVTQPLDLVRAGSGLVGDPAGACEKASDAMLGLQQALGAGFAGASPTPLNRTIGGHRRFDWLTLDLQDVKSVKRALGGTVNDVVLATVAGAVARFLESRGIAARQQRELDFRAFCPVSVRDPSERGTLGNRISGMIASLPIGEMDARKRLARVRETTEQLKSSRQALGAEVLAAVSEWTLPTLLSLAARLSARSRAYNLVVTNVPGPQLPLYLLGSRMISPFPLVPLFNNQALGIALFSYDGRLCWGFNADWDLVPDLHDFVDAVSESFEELRRSASVADRHPPSERRIADAREVAAPSRNGGPAVE
jgi:WS/DGAT/MGAT family acyltransferase